MLCAQCTPWFFRFCLQQHWWPKSTASCTRHCKQQTLGHSSLALDTVGQQKTNMIWPQNGPINSRIQTKTAKLKNCWPIMWCNKMDMVQFMNDSAWQKLVENYHFNHNASPHQNLWKISSKFWWAMGIFLALNFAYCNNLYFSSNKRATAFWWKSW